MTQNSSEHKQKYQPPIPPTQLQSQLQKIPMNPQVLQLFKQLNKQIQVLDHKVQLLMDQHQSQFVLAYQSHARKIKADLEALRKKTDEQEKELKDNNRAIMLEKQTIVFRDEALKLYQRLEAKTQESQFYKYRAKDLEKTTQIMQKQIRQTLKSRKLLQTKLSFAQNKVQTLQEQLLQKNEQIKKLNETISIQLVSNSTNNNDSTLQLHQKSHIYSKQSTKLRETRSQFKKRSASFTSLAQDQQLKEWFLECVKAVKKEIAARKVGKDKDKPTGFQSVRTIQEFKMVDKLKLLEKFVENERLLTWMYQKIFPGRTNQLKEYLSHRSFDNRIYLDPTQQSQQIQNQRQISKALIDGPQRIEITLPKMQTPKSRKDTISNRLLLREGKLRIINQ